MKAVLMSIKPKWCELIAQRKKTIEVRRTKPKLNVPFKVYIYCTKRETVYLPSDIFGNEPIHIPDSLDSIGYWSSGCICL